MTETEVMYTLILLHQETGAASGRFTVAIVSKFNSVWLPLDNSGNNTLYPEQLHCDI